MLKKYIIGLIALLALASCRLLPEPEKTENVFTKEDKEFISNLFNPPFQELDNPPKIVDYPNYRVDDLTLYRYTDDLNWYLMNLFGYVTIINNYAKDRGYIPPKTDPICKVVEWPKFEPLPAFKFTEHTDRNQLEVELTFYINTLKEEYESQQRVYKEAELTQRKLCIY